MPEMPVPYDPSLDEPVVPIRGVTDERIQTIAAAGAEFQQLIRDLLPENPNVEAAARHVDLAVQAALAAAQDAPPVATGEPQEGAQAL